MAVLIISTGANTHANAVERNLLLRGCDVSRLNMDSVTSDSYLLTLRGDHTCTLPIQQHSLQGSKVRAVFVHHATVGPFSSIAYDDLDWQLHASAWRNAIDWLEHSLDTAIWFNGPQHSRAAASPARQLHIAKLNGLRVPETIFTNDIEEARALAGRHTRIVVKSGPLLGVRLDGQRLLTQLVDAETLRNEDLYSSPCLFQEYIEKEYELRLHVIGETVLACKIESQQANATKIDWRNYAISQTPHTMTNISANLSEQCVRIVKHLGLTFGIIDIIVTPQEESVFLECNSQGHWLWIEELTGLPITKTLCDSLDR